MTQEKRLLFLYFDLFCRFFLIFSFSFFPFVPPPLQLPILLELGNPTKLLGFFFFLSSITFFIVVLKLCLYIGILELCEVLLFFFFSFFLILIFLNLLLFFLHLFLCLLFLLFFSPCNQSLMYINLLHITLFNFAYLFFLTFFFSPFLSKYMLVLFSLLYSPIGTLL